LGSDHRGGTDPQARGRHKEQPSRRTGGDVLLGYSGRAALRREQCDVLPESRNIGFGQYRRIRHNAPLKALLSNQLLPRQRVLIETFPRQR
jgi:hypothetical protein